MAFSEAASPDVSVYAQLASQNRRTLSVFSRRGPTPKPAVRPVNMRTSPASPSRSMRWKPGKNKHKAKKTGTVLHAVPANAPAPLSHLEHEMVTSPNDEILCAIGRPPLPSEREFPYESVAHSSRAQSITSSHYSSSSTARSHREGAVPLGGPDADGPIGVWKNGRVHWDAEPTMSLVANASDAFARLDSTPNIASPSAKKNRRPRIQVIIPNDHRLRRFPSLQFFGQSSTKPQSATPKILSGVSPHSGTQKVPLRTSVVSPLITLMPKPVRPFAAASSQLAIIGQGPESSPLQHRPKPSMSSSDEDSQVDDDSASSNYSRRSSMTSLGSSSSNEVEPIKLCSRSGSVAFSIHSPVAAGVFEEANAVAPRRFAPHPTPEPTEQEIKVCLKVPVMESPMLGLHHRSLPNDQNIDNVLGLSRAERTSCAPLLACGQSGIKKRTSCGGLARRSTTSLRGQNGVQRRVSKSLPPTPPSPTLSEAQLDLEQQLISITDRNPFHLNDVLDRTSGGDVDFDDLYASPAPSVPRKSSKRISRISPAALSVLHSRCPSIHIPFQYDQPTAKGSLKHSWSKGREQTLNVTIPESPKSATESCAFSPIPIPAPEAEIQLDRNITPKAAEQVILSILQSLESLDDLFATAVVNKGFYRVFKRYEVELMKRALRKMSPPAWEHRQICPPHDEGGDLETSKQIDYTPTTYLQCYIRDMYIIAALKSLILDQCQSFLRPETVASLASNDHVGSSRVDNAFWRIWSFCKLFGSGKGREDDIVAQMDWLRGGALVHQQACRSTIFSTDSYDASSILATAPEHFAKGNDGGLTAEQLYDMTELWNCLGVVLQGFDGRTGQAREYGVFESTDVRGGDIDGEEFMLEEWYYYLLTLGLSAILDLATPSKRQDSSIFVLASENGWVKWNVPQHGGSRKTFLKEAVARVYEDKIAASFSSQGQKEMLRALSKQRIQKHILEIRKRKMTGESREVTMSQERPMSNWENVFNRFTGPQSAQASRVPSMHVSRVPSMAHSPPSYALPTVPRARSVAHMTSAPPPPLENHPAFVQHPLQRQIHQSDMAENTADKAIYRIVEMGFTADQARHALRMTDLGDGLRVDRAVELLLRA